MPLRRRGSVNSSQKGALAEEKAARHLASLGYKIIERNFKTRLGEIDIIAKDGETLVFVEVRSKKPGALVGAAESVDARKRAKILRAAAFYAQRNELDGPMRFDVVAIDGESLEHIQDAFGA